MDQKRLLFVPRVLWIAMILSVLMFLVILQVVPLPPAPLNPVMAPALALVAVLVAGASFVMPRLVLRQALAKAELRVIDEADPGAFGSFYREAAPRRRIFADRGAAVRAALAAYQTSFILSVALSEAVALFGFVLAFQGFAPVAWAPLYAAGLILIAIRFPTARRMLGPLEQAYNAIIPPEDAGKDIRPGA